MQNPRDNTLHCVSCRDKTGIEDEQIMQEDSDTPHTSIPEDSPAYISILSPADHQQIISDASAVLSQKMLQGYTLLSQNCPKSDALTTNSRENGDLVLTGATSL